MGASRLDFLFSVASGNFLVSGLFPHSYNQDDHINSLIRWFIYFVEITESIINKNYCHQLQNYYSE